MPANETLAKLLSDNVRQEEDKLPAVARAYKKLVDRLSNGGAAASAPREGDALRPFRLPDERGNLVTLADLLARGPLVVSINRGHWCSYCGLELDALRDIHSEIQELGASLVAITPERSRFAKQLKEEHGLEFPVLCDVESGYALSLGLAFWCGEELIPLYKELGFDLPSFQGAASWILPIPATYVVAPDGGILSSYVNADFRRRMEPEKILAALQTRSN